jgi:hypothetical protein
MVGMARRAVPAREVAGGTNVRATPVCEGVAPLNAARTSRRDVIYQAERIRRRRVRPSRPRSHNYLVCNWLRKFLTFPSSYGRLCAAMQESLSHYGRRKNAECRLKRRARRLGEAGPDASARHPYLAELRASARRSVAAPGGSARYGAGGDIAAQWPYLNQAGAIAARCPYHKQVPVGGKMGKCSLMFAYVRLCSLMFA